MSASIDMFSLSSYLILLLSIFLFYCGFKDIFEFPLLSGSRERFSSCDPLSQLASSDAKLDRF